jgi:hypothetical protein
MPIPSSAKAGFSARDAFHREFGLGLKRPRRVADGQQGTANPLRVVLIASEPNRFVLGRKLSDFSGPAKASFLGRGILQITPRRRSCRKAVLSSKVTAPFEQD